MLQIPALASIFKLVVLIHFGKGTHSRKRKLSEPMATQMKRLLLALIIASVGNMFCTPVSAQTYTTMDDPVSVNGTFPAAISGNYVVGIYYDANYIDHGFLFNISTGRFMPLDYELGVNGTSPNAIYGNYVVGTYWDGNNIGHGFLYNIGTGGFSSFDDEFGVNGTYAMGVSDKYIVGQFVDMFNYGYGFVYNIDSGDFTTLTGPIPEEMSGSVNIWTDASAISGNNVVGTYYDTNGFQFVYIYNMTTGSYTTLDGNPVSAVSWNDVLGNVGSPSSAFLYNISTGLYTFLDDPLNVNGTGANGISGNFVVGYYLDSGGIAHAFLYNIAANSFTHPVNPLNANSFGYTDPVAISGNHVVGNYTDANGESHGFLLTLPPLGIDVSKNQGLITDWSMVKASGISFAFVETTLGGPPDVDPNFEHNVRGFLSIGVPVGVYHLAYPQSNAVPTIEANNFLNYAGEYIGNGFLPPVLDIEGNIQPAGDLSLSQWITDWMLYVQQKTGVAPILYANTSTLNSLDPALTGSYNIWAANYDNSPTFASGSTVPGNWLFKQYGTNGVICGISGNKYGEVDLDSFLGDPSTLSSLTDYPLAPTSVRFITGVDGAAIQPPKNGQFTFEVVAPGQQQVNVQQSADLLNWNDMGAVNPVNGTATLTDSNATGTMKFYRAAP